MEHCLPATALQLRTLIKTGGELELSLVDVPVTQPQPDEVLIRVEAAPINPSDQGLLFGAANLSEAVQEGTADRPVIRAPLSPKAMAAMAARVGQSLPAGNEGAGTVVAAGGSGAAQALLGKRVAALTRAMYSQYQLANLDQCMVLPPDATAEEGASSFVNPLTALGMVETMRAEGHRALVHTAAASNLGQMLNRICRKDGIGLVNIVRKPDQAEILKALGADHVCDSSSPGFEQDLTAAIAATGATIAFDAIGGGGLANQILQCMERVLARGSAEYSRYGTSILKQIYVYGGLDSSPTFLDRSYGFAWSVASWLVFPYLQRLGPEVRQRLQDRVAAELKTTFASHYLARITMQQMLTLEAIGRFSRRATGEKYLLLPNG